MHCARSSATFSVAVLLAVALSGCSSFYVKSTDTVRIGGLGSDGASVVWICSRGLTLGPVETYLVPATDAAHARKLFAVDRERMYDGVTAKALTRRGVRFEIDDLATIVDRWWKSDAATGVMEDRALALVSVEPLVFAVLDADASAIEAALRQSQVRIGGLEFTPEAYLERWTTGARIDYLSGAQVLLPQADDGGYLIVAFVRSSETFERTGRFTRLTTEMLEAPVELRSIWDSERPGAVLPHASYDRSREPHLR